MSCRERDLVRGGNTSCVRKVVIAAVALGVALTGGHPNRATLADRQEDDLAVLTANICGYVCNWAADQGWQVARDTSRLLRQHQPDVVMLQEVCATQLETLLGLVDGDYHGRHFETFNLGNGCRFGNAVMWSDHLDISGHVTAPLRTRARQGTLEVTDEPRVLGCVYGTRGLFCVAHLVPDYPPVTPGRSAAYAALRDLQIRDLVTAIQATRVARSVVLAGDFNAADDAVELKRVTDNLALVPTAPRCGCIDHIFVDPNLYRPATRWVLDVQRSDHDAVLTLLRPK